MADPCQPAMDDLIAFNTPPRRNLRQSLGLNRTHYPLHSHNQNRCPVDQLLDWNPAMEQHNVDDLLSYSPPPLRKPPLFINEQPGIVHNLAQLHPDIRVQGATPSPRKQSPSPSYLPKPQYGPHFPPPDINILQATPIAQDCIAKKQNTPILCIDRKVRHKSNILGGDEENRARWTDIQLKFGYLKNSFDYLYSGLFLNLASVRPPNQPWALRPEPQKCTYEDGFRDYPTDTLDLYLDNWGDFLDNENDIGQDLTLMCNEDCNIQMENVDGELNMGTFLRYELDDDKGDGEVNVSIKVLETKCTEVIEISDESNEEDDESIGEVCNI